MTNVINPLPKLNGELLSRLCTLDHPELLTRLIAPREAGRIVELINKIVEIQIVQHMAAMHRSDALGTRSDK